MKISIYVACLAAYNSGELHGEWIDCTQGEDHIHEGIKKILATSPEQDAEEWAIHDTEGFGTIHISENHNIETLVEYAEFINEHFELGSELIAHFGGDLDDAKEAIEEQYYGEHKNAEYFAMDYCEQAGYETPDWLNGYIDYEKLGRDMLMCDFFEIEVNGMIHVFSNR